jgi:peptide/nickel transport system substrate-binding protein
MRSSSNRQPWLFGSFDIVVPIAVALAVATGPACGRSTGPESAAGGSNAGAGRAGGAGTIVPGGGIVASMHTDPRTFNRYLNQDASSDLVATLTHAKLVRLNRVTQNIEPWLAESWTRSDDGLRYTMKLRPNVSFSDGQPFTSDDVLFSFEAAYDDREGVVMGSALTVGRKPLHVAAPDPLTVVVTFPEPFAPGVRILDNLPILPRHKLGAALKAGTFAKMWGLSTPPGELAGLGPFVLTAYSPGQRLEFVRNPRYWRKDVNGAALPYLDRITIEIVPQQDAELLRLEAGQLDMTDREMRPEDYTPLKRAADAGRVKVLDLGVSFDADSLWFNLKPGGLGPADRRAPWLQHVALRRAISMAVDRQLFANTVFLGAGVPVYGPITPANRKWFANLPPVPHDPAGAKSELAAIGLTDKNGDGLLEDANNQPVRFSLLAQKGNTSIERGAAVIRDELKKIGVTIDVVALDGSGVIQRFLSAQYDAVYFHLTTTDSDPAITPDFWLSSGSAHAWNLEQPKPATPWEARIDELMRRQIASPDEAERKRLFDEVQMIFAEQLPTIQFVAPRIYLAASARVFNLTPTSFSRPQLLWAPDTIAVLH